MNKAWPPFASESPTSSSPRLVRALSVVAGSAGAAVAATGAAVLLGWAADIGWLKDPVGAFVDMMPITAVMLILAGLSLGLSLAPLPSRLRRGTARALAASSALLAAAMLAEDLLGRDLGIEGLLFHTLRPAVASSLAMLLASVAILAIDVRFRRGPAPAEFLAGGVVAIGSLTLGAYLYGAIQFYISSGPPHARGMAIHTSVALLALGVGIVAARPASGVMRIFTSVSVGGQVVRRMLLVALLIPLLGYVATRLQAAGAYVPPGAAVVTAVMGMLVAAVITFAVGESLDNTDRLRRRREEEVSRARSLLDALVRASPLAIVAVDLEGKVELWNPAAEQLFAWKADEVIGKPLAVIPAEEANAFAKLRERLLVGKEVVAGLEHKRMRRDGTRFDARSSAAPLTRNGELVGMMALIEDVTARKRALEALRESEERFRLALDEAPIGMALVGIDGRFLRVNTALCEIVGYSSEELMGLTFPAITHPDDVDLDVALAGDLARGRIPRYQLAKRYVRKDGATVDVMLSGSIVRAADGAPLYYIAQIENVTDRKRAEEALRRSEAQFRELIEQAPDAVFIADLEGRYTRVNTAACRMLGYAREELVGKNIADLIAPEDAPRLARDRELLLVPGQVQVGDWTLKAKDGTPVPVEVSAKIHADGRWVAFARDVSERKRSQEALQRSEASLARAQRVAHLGSWDWDLRTDEVTRSAELLDLFGLEPGEVSSRRWSMRDRVHRDDVVAVERAVDAAAHEGRAYSLEHRILRKDRSERVVLHQGEPVLVDGRVVRMVGTLLDITERKRAESEREDTLQWLRAVLDQIPVGVILLHARGAAPVETNRRMRVMLGKTLERLDEDPDRVLDADERPLRLEELPSVRALRGEAVDGCEYFLRNAAGTLVPVLESAVPVVDASGAVLGAVVAVLDITAAKELERLRAEWGSVVAHDLRQPLNTIMLSVQMLARAGEDVARRGRLLGNVQAAARRLDRMVGDLMDLSRLEARRLELARQPTDVTAAVRASVELVEQSAPDRRFDVIVHGSIPPASADADRVAQIVENLLSNAVKYGAPGTPIRIEERRGEGELSVAVTNEGAGIPPEQIPRLFQRFQRTESAKGSRIKGTGLGLYITRELVEAHGGRIMVESTPGATTTFRFTLPLA